MATVPETASMILTRDDLEVMDECLSSQLRTLRNKVVTTWKDKEFYDKVKALREEVEEELECFSWLTELEDEKNDSPEIRTRTFFQEEKEAVTLAEAMREKQELDKETEELLRPFFPELEDEKKEESEGANNE